MVRMSAGLVYGSITGEQLAAGHHYGSAFSFGYYQIFYTLFDRETLSQPDRVASLINGTGVIAAALFGGAWTLLCRRAFSPAASTLASFGLLLSPMVMPFLGSAHPMVGAGAMVLLSAWLLMGQGNSISGTIGPTSEAAATSEVSTRQRWLRPVLSRHLERIGGWLCMLAALCLRAEVALALPFMVVLVLFARYRPSFREAIHVGIGLAGVLTAFFILQRPLVEQSGGATGTLSEFFRAFYVPSRIFRGLALFFASFGLLSSIALVWLLIRRLPEVARHRNVLVRILPGAALLVPELVFWLPNPQPVRHFILALVGLVFMAVPILEMWIRRVRPARIVVASVVVAIGNQAAAETIRPAIVARYDWSYPAASARRATQQIPMLGITWLDHVANRQAESILQNEARWLASTRPVRLLVFADSQHYLIAHLLSADPSLRMTAAPLAGVGTLVVWLTNSERRIGLVEKYTAWPIDVKARVLAEPAWAGWMMYEQAATRSRFDSTHIPAERDWRIPSAQRP